MIDILVYKIVHLLGIMMLFLSLGGSLVHSLNGGSPSDNRWKKVLGATHGVGLLFILVSGFGMLARLNILWPLPGWVYLKFGIWLAFGAAMTVINRLGRSGSWLWYALLALGVLAAYLGLYKPFGTTP